MQEVLNHDWVMKEACAITQAPLTKAAIQNLKSFRQKDKLQRASLHLLTKYMDDSSVDSLKLMFQTMDVDGEGTLSILELQHGLTHAGFQDVGTDMAELIKSLDTDGSGQIDYSEFLAATIGRKQYLQEDKVWQVFKHFDFDHTGTINKDNLTVILTGGDCSKFSDAVGRQAEEISEILKSHDKDGNGELDFDEFLALMKMGERDDALAKVHPGNRNRGSGK